MEAGDTVPRDYNRAELRYNWVVIKMNTFHTPFIFPQKLYEVLLFTMLNGILVLMSILIFSVPLTKKLLTTDKLHPKLSCTNRKEEPVMQYFHSRRVLFLFVK